MAFPGFPDAAVSFLAGLARHNDRAWFQPRKELYEQAVKLPMTDLVAELNRDLDRIAPDFVVDQPDKAVSRIYRDVRFAKDKSPYKTNIYAVWRRREVARHEGPAFYVSLSGKEVEAGGGLWMPAPPLLARVRGVVAGEHARLRKLLAGARMKKVGAELYTDERLARVPRGFAADHPAEDLLRLRHFVVTTSWPAKLATTARLHKQIAAAFAAVAPLVTFLDAAVASD
jgi:uncharacterized protein (TIGR02453 family)